MNARLVFGTTTLLTALATTPAQAQFRTRFDNTSYQHAAASAILYNTTKTLGNIAHNKLGTPHINTKTAIAITLAAGIAKEAYDLASYGTADFGDLTSDIAGTALGIGLETITKKLWKATHPNTTYEHNPISIHYEPQQRRLKVQATIQR